MKYLRILLAIIGAACLLALLPGTAHAAINAQISFQGKLTNPDGTNVTDGNYSIRFRIYTDPSADTGSCANTCKWEETQGSVAVSGGLFHVQLGSGTALPGSVDFNNSTLYLGVKVGTDAEMTPRVRLTAAPYTFNSDLLDGMDSAAFLQLSPGAQQTGNLNISGTVTSGAVNGITVGSTLQPSAAGALTVRSNGSNALTLTSGAAATWSTTAGLLTVQGFSGVTINSPGASGATGAIALQSGNSSAGTAGNVTIDTGTTSTGTPAVNIANTNAKAVQIGNNTSNPSITIDSGTGTIAIGTGAQARTVNVGTGGAAQTVTVGSGNGASTLDLQAGTGGIDIVSQGTGAINIGNNAVAQTLNIGNSTGATAVTIASGTGNLALTTQGTGQLNIGNNAMAQTINIGNGTGATTVAVLCGTGACGFGNNAVAHATTVGSTTGTATTILQAGTGGLSLTSGGNITIGTADANATLLVLDSKSGSGDPTAANGGMYYNSTNNKFRCAQNSIWSDCTIGFTSITKTADQAATQNSTTLQNDSALVFAGSANATYIFDAWIPVDASNATADFKYAFTVPAGATFNVATIASATNCGLVTSGTACIYIATNPTTLMLQMRGVVVMGGTAGNIQFQFAQNTATAVSFPVIKKGSVLMWRQSN